MNNLYLYAWNRFSAGAKALAEALDIPRIKHENSRFRPSPNKLVINWGSSTLPEHILGCNVLNSPYNVATVANKMDFFCRMVATQDTEDAVRHVPFTFNREEAQRWVDQERAVVVRHKVDGSGGEGIQIVSSGTVPRAPLYTLYVKKLHEYRVHVVNGRVVDIQRKGLRRNERGEAIRPADMRIRTHTNGFIFIREGTEATPEDVLDQALRAVRASRLVFGAVDIAFNNHEKKAYVLEVNSAPGLEGQTVQSYANAFKEVSTWDGVKTLVR